MILAMAKDVVTKKTLIVNKPTLGAPFVTSNIQTLLRSRLVVGRYEKLRTGVKRNMFNTRSLPKHN
mgnify:CR=1 FL=1